MNHEVGRAGAQAPCSALTAAATGALRCGASFGCLCEGAEGQLRGNAIGTADGSSGSAAHVGLIELPAHGPHPVSTSAAAP